MLLARETTSMSELKRLSLTWPPFWDARCVPSKKENLITSANFASKQKDRRSSLRRFCHNSSLPGGKAALRAELQTVRDLGGGHGQDDRGRGAGRRGD